MRYNGDSTGQDIVTMCDDYANTNSVTFPIEKKTRAANKTLRKIWSWIFDSYGGWKYDDNNLSGLPETINTLTSGVNEYAVPTEASDIIGIDILKQGQTLFVPLIPITVEEARRRGYSDKNLFSSTGTPKYYSLIGNSAIVYPTPNYTQASSIRFTYGRGVSAFATTDTTKEPGFDSNFHDAVPVGMALEYGKQNTLPNFTILQEDMNDYERRIKAFYSKRFQEKFPAKIKMNDSIREYE